MNDRDAIDMARRCAGEIKMLRRHIAELAPKAEAYDALLSVLNLLPRPSQGHAPDLVWQLERQITDLEAAMSQPKGEPA